MEDKQDMDAMLSSGNRRIVPLSILFALSFFSLIQAALQLSVPLFLMQIFDRVLSTQHGETLFLLTGIFLFAAIAFGLIDVVRQKIVGRFALIAETKLLFLADHSPISDLERDAVAKDVGLLKNVIGSGVFLALLDLMWLPLVLLLIAGLASGLALSLCLLQAVLLAIIVFSSLGSNSGRDGLAPVMRSDIAAQEIGFFRLIRFSGQVLLLGLAGWYALSGFFSAGALIAFSFLMMRAIAPIEQLMGTRQLLVPASRAANRLRAFAATCEICDEQHKKPIPSSGNDVRLEKVYLKSPSGSGLALAGLTTSFQAGTITALTGPSGAGKSALCAVVTGAVPLVSGQVYLGEEMVSRLSCQNRLQRISTVSERQFSPADAMLPVPLGAARLETSRAALESQAELYVFDNPECHLDRSQLADLISLFQKKRAAGACILIATNAAPVVAAADKVLRLVKGVLVSTDATDQSPRLVTAELRSQT